MEDQPHPCGDRVAVHGEDVMRRKNYGRRFPMRPLPITYVLNYTNMANASEQVERAVYDAIAAANGRKARGGVVKPGLSLIGNGDPELVVPL